jgi:hypothetical protein
MTSSYSTTASTTFTVVHARHIASKVATDLKRIQRFYSAPPDKWIEDYEAELIEFLKNDVVDHVIYGFKRNDKWTEATLRYSSSPGGSLLVDDDPGKIRPGLDIVNATFTSFLSYNSKWFNLTASEQAAITCNCPFQRTTGSSPVLEMGYWYDDLNYSAGGRGLGRSTVRR